MLLDFVSRNKLPLALLPASPALSRLAEDPLFGGALAREQREHDTGLSEYSAVLRLWTSEGIPAVLIKSVGEFPYTSDNLDVLVSPGDAGRAKKVLLECGYTELPHVREPFKDLYRRFATPDAGFALHLHQAVGWINVFFTADEIIAASRESARVPGLRSPSPEHAFMITTAHWFYEDKEMKLRDLYHAVRCGPATLDWDAVSRGAETRGWRDGLGVAALVYQRAALEALGSPLMDPSVERGLSGNISAAARAYAGIISRRPVRFPFRLSRAANKFLHYAKSFQDRTLTPGEKLSDALLLTRYMVQVKVVPRLRSRFMLAAISGVDHSGKSTLARNLAAMLGRSGVRTRTRWIRIGSSGFLEAVKRPFKRGPVPATPRKLSVSVAGGRRGLVSAWVLVLAADVWIRTWCFFLLDAIRGGLVICDRFGADHLVDLRCDYGTEGAAFRISERLFRTLPTPGLSVWLDGDTSAILSRVEDEGEKPAVEARIRMYRERGVAAGEKLDAALPPEKLADIAYRSCMAAYFRGESGS